MTELPTGQRAQFFYITSISPSLHILQYFSWSKNYIFNYIIKIHIKARKVETMMDVFSKCNKWGWKICNGKKMLEGWKQPQEMTSPARKDSAKWLPRSYIVLYHDSSSWLFRNISFHFASVPLNYFAPLNYSFILNYWGTSLDGRIILCLILCVCVFNVSGEAWSDPEDDKSFL